MRNMHAALMQAETKRREGDLRGSEKLCRAILAEDPLYVGALQTFGLVSIAKENFPQAVTCFTTAAAEAPEDWTNFLNLGITWLGLEQPQMAALMLREARKLNDSDAETLRLLGEIAMDQREYDAAMASLRGALERNPDDLKAMAKLADCYANLGFFDKAQTILTELHEKRPDWIAVLGMLLQLPRGMTDIDFGAAIGKVKPQASEPAEIFENTKQFLQAANHDREGEPEKAWDILVAANAHVHASNQRRHQKALERRKSELEAARTINVGSAAKTKSDARTAPLFIMGASRAGKTTLEVVLSAHADIHRGYENDDVSNACKRASQSAGLTKISRLSGLPEPLHGSFSDFFESHIDQVAAQKKYITNTNPGLIGSAAQLANALRHARFVFVTRDRNDLALRIFMKKYKRGNEYAYDLSTIFKHIDWVETMIALLVKKLGKRALHIRYEELVADPQLVSEQVLDLCGLHKAGFTAAAVGSDVGASAPYRMQLESRS
ncbi:MAG: sulfotransferase [Pseudomonadota bacterium]